MAGLVYVRGETIETEWRVVGQHTLGDMLIWDPRRSELLTYTPLEEVIQRMPVTIRLEAGNDPIGLDVSAPVSFKQPGGTQALQAHVTQCRRGPHVEYEIAAG